MKVEDKLDKVHNDNLEVNRLTLCWESDFELEMKAYQFVLRC